MHGPFKGVLIKEVMTHAPWAHCTRSRCSVETASASSQSCIGSGGGYSKFPWIEEGRGPRGSKLGDELMFDVDADLDADDTAGPSLRLLSARVVDRGSHLVKPDQRPILERLMTTLRTPIYNMIWRGILSLRHLLDGVGTQGLSSHSALFHEAWVCWGFGAAVSCWDRHLLLELRGVCSPSLWLDGHLGS